MNRTLKITTALSLLLNVLLVGGIAGHNLRDDNGGPPPWHHGSRQIATTLPADKRELFEKTMRQLDADNEGFHDQLDAARTEATRLLKADPFDKDAYLAQMQRIHDIHGQLMGRVAKAIADTAQKLTPDERVQLSDMFRNPQQPGGHRPPPPNENAPPPPHENRLRVPDEDMPLPPHDGNPPPPPPESDGGAPPHP